MNSLHQRLFAEIEQGLPLVAQPYQALAHKLDTTEAVVIETIQAWQQQGLIRRFGLVVRHRSLGYQSNAMVVWDLPDDQIDTIAKQLATESAVTLCYQRPRVLPQWPYNLFCMIHGKDIRRVVAQIDDICQRHQLEHINKDILFSFKAYKQRGARYSKVNEAATGAS